MTVKERICSIRLLDKQKEYADYFNELGLLGKTIVVNSQRVNCEEQIEEGGDAIC
jgi:uncharacterized protein (UPF0210 family)